MKRNLPLISISGIAFCIDVVAEQLVEYNNPENRICFCRLSPVPNGYTLLFNKDTGSCYQGVELLKANDFVLTEIPPMCKLDPVGLAEKYGRYYDYFMGMETDGQWLEELGEDSRLRRV